MRAAAFVALIVLASLLSHVPARAAFHLMMVTEVFAGLPQHPNAQFVELQMYAGGQNVVSGREVAVYNAANTKIGSFVFPANVPSGANQSSILIATMEAQSLFGMSADLTMTPVILSAGGKICFAGSIDCVSWGSYAGPVSGVGLALSPGEGLLAGASATRRVTGALDPTDDTNDSARDFRFTAPTPRNNAGTTGVRPYCVVSFGALPAAVREDAGTATIPIAGCAGARVTFSTAGGSATPNVDYETVSTTVDLAGPATTASVPLMTDAMFDPSETIGVRLRNPVNAFLDMPDALVTIEDVPVDTDAPDTAITTGPPAFTAERVAEFTLVSSEPDASFFCSLDEAPFSACDAIHRVDDVPAGAHRLRARAVDAAGNADDTPAEHEWLVDLTPPDARFVRPTPQRSYVNDIEVSPTPLTLVAGSMTVQVQITDAESAIAFTDFRIDDEPVDPRTISFDESTGIYSFPWTPERAGAHSIDARARNRAGTETAASASVFAL